MFSQSWIGLGGIVVAAALVGALTGAVAPSQTASAYGPQRSCDRDAVADFLKGCDIVGVSFDEISTALLSE